MKESNNQEFSGRTIAVWGSYLWGNFGDDVMAICISLFLKEKGYKPVVYKLDPVISKKYGIDSEQDIKTLFEKATACVIGGGGLLCSSALMEDEYKQLFFALDRYRVPVHICSIGGDGGGNLPLLSLYFTKCLMLPVIKSATVRLKTDVRFFHELGVPCEYFPDIVLSTSRFFPADRKKGAVYSKRGKESLKILVNIKKRKHIQRLSKALHIISKLRRVKINYIRTHLAWLKPDEPPFLDYEYLPESKKEDSIVYESIEQVQDVILNTNLVLSDKLHLGVFALAYGTPFISINGANKTRAFLKEADLEDNIVHMKAGFLTRLYFFILRKKRMEATINKVKNHQPLQKMIDESVGHFESLKTFLDNNTS